MGSDFAFTPSRVRVTMHTFVPDVVLMYVAPDITRYQQSLGTDSVGYTTHPEYFDTVSCILSLAPILGKG
jgi:hypothetical protein